MPTGYTADVQSGKITEFNDFVMQCARAFGALVTMRDSPADATIPDRFEPSDYHDKELVEARDRIAFLKRLSDEDKEREASAAFDRRMSEWRRRCDQRIEHKARYSTMLEKVRAWEPPTSEHTGLKDFMVKQLSESIDVDCSSTYDDEPQRQTGEEWFACEMKEANRSFKYHTKERACEHERAASRTKWVRDLRSSLQHKD